MVNYIVLDTETTGLKSPVKAVEIAWLEISEQFEVLTSHVYRSDPLQPIDPGAEAIHGISYESVRGLPTNDEICSMIPKGKVVVIGHNCSYDIGVVGEHLQFVDQLCTLALARAWVKGTTNHKLGTLRQELSLPDQKDHSALGDCYTSLEVLKHVAKLSNRSLPALIDVERLPKMLNSMPFGMHKGKKFQDIPVQYKDWLLERDIPRDLRYSLEKTRIL